MEERDVQKRGKDLPVDFFLSFFFFSRAKESAMSKARCFASSRRNKRTELKKQVKEEKEAEEGKSDSSIE